MLGKKLKLKEVLGCVFSAYWKASSQNYRSKDKTSPGPSFGQEVLASTPPKSNKVYEASHKTNITLQQIT